MKKRQDLIVHSKSFTQKDAKREGKPDYGKSILNQEWGKNF